MSDFLGNLAATALQVAPIAQPRAPALFESRTVSNDMPLIETGEVERVAAPPVQSTVETRRTERENVMQSNAVSRSKMKVLESISRSEVGISRSELRPSTIVKPMSAVQPAPKIEPWGRGQQSGRAETANSVVEEISTQISTSPLEPRASAREIIQPRINRQSIETRLASEPVEPSIHISIGRIEVRAATAPAPTRAAKREASVLNLDDYLRQRR